MAKKIREKESFGRSANQRQGNLLTESFSLKSDDKGAGRHLGQGIVVGAVGFVEDRLKRSAREAKRRDKEINEQGSRKFFAPS